MGNFKRWRDIATALARCKASSRSRSAESRPESCSRATAALTSWCACRKACAPTRMRSRHCRSRCRRARMLRPSQKPRGRLHRPRRPAMSPCPPLRRSRAPALHAGCRRFEPVTAHHAVLREGGLWMADHIWEDGSHVGYIEHGFAFDQRGRKRYRAEGVLPPQSGYRPGVRRPAEGLNATAAERPDDKGLAAAFRRCSRLAGTKMFCAFLDNSPEPNTLEGVLVGWAVMGNVACRLPITLLKQAEIAARMALAESDPAKARAMHILALEYFDKAHEASTERHRRQPSPLTRPTSSRGSSRDR